MAEKALQDHEIENIALRSFAQFEISRKSKMTVYDFTKWATNTIERSEDLADAFRVIWRYAKLSDFVRRDMSYVHQFRVGLITLPELQWHIERQLSVFRKALAVPRKRIIHQRALNMGADDPTKPDYSKYMSKKRSRKFDTKMRPLQHGLLMNRHFVNEEIQAFWATRLQSHSEGPHGRVNADSEAKRQAFYAAKELARASAEAKVREEYEGQEALPPGMKKSKWDAKVRMMQVKLRTKGLSLNREETVRYMVDKGIDKAMRKVEKSFHIMEKERGFAMTDMEREAQAFADKARLAYLKQLEDRRAEEEAEETQKQERDNASSSDDEDLAALDYKALMGEETRKEMAAAEKERQRRRRRAIITAGYLTQGEGAELFVEGETLRERRLRRLLSHPNPTRETLSKNLRNLHRNLTAKRVGEMLQELPTKRMLIQYMLRFRNANDLAWHLTDHFGFLPRDNVEMAKRMMAMMGWTMQYG